MRKCFFFKSAPRRGAITRRRSHDSSADPVTTLPKYDRYKDSGIEWIGEIPEHWEVKRISHLGLVGNGSTPTRGNPRYWNSADYPWLNSGSVNQGIITEADQFVSNLALKECHLPLVKPGSIVIAITGQGKTRGTAALLMSISIKRILRSSPPNSNPKSKSSKPSAAPSSPTQSPAESEYNTHALPPPRRPHPRDRPNPRRFWRQGGAWSRRSTAATGWVSRLLSRFSGISP